MIKDIKDKYFKKVYLKQSNISGTGLFAGENIDKGEIILIFGGNLSFRQNRYTGKFLRSTCIGITEELILGETEFSKKDLSDYINHSCNPNAGLEDSITLVAIKDIRINEEILCDYAIWEDEEEWLMKDYCQCGAQNCRHTISGKDWKKIKSTDFIFNFCSPFIQRRILNYEEAQSKYFNYGSI